MKFIVATLGSAGDLHPFLAIARALHEQGHDVVLASAESHRAEVQREGVPFSPILSAHDHERALGHPELWHPVRGFGVLWRHMAVRSVEATEQLLLEALAVDPDVRVLASPLVLGARLCADTLPIRLLTAHTAPNGLRSHQHPMFVGGRLVPAWCPDAVRRGLWRLLDRHKLQPMAKPVIDRWRQRHGLPPLTEPVFERWMHSPHGVLGLFPATFGPQPTDWPVPVHCVGFPLFQPAEHEHADPEVDKLLASSGAQGLWVFYPGSAPTGAAERIRNLAVDMARIGHPALLISPSRSIGWARTAQAADSDALTTLLVRPRVSLAEVLPQASGFIHHGGIGAVAQGLAAGVRQWIAPSAYDQHDNAWRLATQFGRDPKSVAMPSSATALALQHSVTARTASRALHSRPTQPNSAVLDAIAHLLRD